MVEIREPDCPRCGQPPAFAVSASQAFCGNNDCKILMWDMTQTRAELETNITEINLDRDDDGGGHDAAR